MQECTTDAIECPVESSKDVLMEILREGAQKMLATAIEVDVVTCVVSPVEPSTWGTIKGLGR